MFPRIIKDAAHTFPASRPTLSMPSPTAPLTAALGAAIERRRALLAALTAEETDCVRLLHGVVEDAPGVTIDRYGPILLVQTWREPLAEGELDALAAVANDALGTTLTPCWNHRGDGPGARRATTPR